MGNSSGAKDSKDAGFISDRDLDMRLDGDAAAVEGRITLGEAAANGVTRNRSASRQRLQVEVDHRSIAPPQQQIGSRAAIDGERPTSEPVRLAERRKRLAQLVGAVSVNQVEAIA
jgi:hypothetical protein